MRDKEIAKNIEIYNVALFLTKSKTLIIGDIHIGYEQELINSGILLPQSQLKKTIDTVSGIIRIIQKDHNSIDTIILNGDIKHEFGTITTIEWREAIQFINHLREKCKEVIVIKGNHDIIFEPIAKKQKITLMDHRYCTQEQVYICHGHALPRQSDKEFKKAKTVIIGHQHPAITLSDGVKKEKYKCFLKTSTNAKGSIKESKTLIVMPQFNPLMEGFDLTREEIISPFIDDLQHAEVIIAGEKPLFFGPFKQLVSH